MSNIIREQLFILWPKDVERRYNISERTRMRWERTNKLPPRDVYIGGVASGWYRTTIEAAERGPMTSKAA